MFHKHKCLVISESKHIKSIMNDFLLEINNTGGQDRKCSSIRHKNKIETFYEHL